MIKDVEKIHFVGIGGIGMSALAQLLFERGKQVTGSDRERSPATELLEKKGITVSIGHGKELLPEGIELLVYSDAVYEDNPERTEGRGRGIPEMSYFDALGEISEDMFTVTVSGAHGKTTTTGMLGKALQDLGEEPTIIVGSIMKDFGSNYVSGKKDFLVVEGCEYNDHFLKLKTDILVITNIEHDHSDYFKDLEHTKRSFKKAVEQLPEDGIVVADPNNPIVKGVLEDTERTIIDYTKLDVPKLKLIGEFNKKNAQAAKATALLYTEDGVKEDIDKSLSEFEGTWRRFEYKGETKNGATVYDDYAHHPTEIRETLKAAREKFPEKKIVVAFHPHLFSRTKTFFDGFVEELGKADTVLLAPIYPAREEDTGEVSSEMLAEKIGEKAKALSTFDEIAEALNKEDKNTLILTMGAGDIFKVANKIVS